MGGVGWGSLRCYQRCTSRNILHRTVPCAVNGRRGIVCCPSPRECVRMFASAHQEALLYVHVREVGGAMPSLLFRCSECTGICLV